MHVLDWLILILVAIGVFFSVRYLRKPKTKGCAGCSRCNVAKTTPKPKTKRKP